MTGGRLKAFLDTRWKLPDVREMRAAGDGG